MMFTLQGPAAFRIPMSDPVAPFGPRRGLTAEPAASTDALGPATPEPARKGQPTGGTTTYGRRRTAVCT